MESAHYLFLHLIHSIHRQVVFLASLVPFRSDQPSSQLRSRTRLTDQLFSLTFPKQTTCLFKPPSISSSYLPWQLQCWPPLVKLVVSNSFFECRSWRAHWIGYQTTTSPLPILFKMSRLTSVRYSFLSDLIMSDLFIPKCLPNAHS